MNEMEIHKGTVIINVSCHDIETVLVYVTQARLETYLQQVVSDPSYRNHEATVRKHTHLL